MPLEPEVQDRIPLEPAQLQLALENLVIGLRVTRVLCFRSEKDQRERYAVTVEGGACLLFAPADSDIVMTLIRNIEQDPPG